MAMDGLALAAVVRELSQQLINCRIDRVYQPRSTDLILKLRAGRENLNLLLSSHPVWSRIHLSKRTFQNPQSPPMFCMVLRKHIEGGRIVGIKQKGLERQLTIEIEGRDELGRLVKKHLVCEIMGKHSNIILLDSDKKTIIDGIKRYSYAVNKYRQVLPGEAYKEPPEQNKFHPGSMDKETLENELLKRDLNTPLWKALLQLIQGFGPVTCRETVYRANLDPDFPLDKCGDYEFGKLWLSLMEIAKIIEKGTYSPTLIKQNKVYIDFFPINPLQYPNENKEFRNNMSEVLEEYYLSKEKEEQFYNLLHKIKKVLKREIGRVSKKAEIQRRKLDDIANAQKYKLFGELIIANIYQIKKGMKEILLSNYYSPNYEKIKVKLNPELSPSENAQRYYKKYNKAISAAKQAKILLNKSLEELNYLNNSLYCLENAENIEELLEIEGELIKEGYIKSKKSTVEERAKKRKQTYFYRYKSSKGEEILVGKNNTSNDRLTMKIASPEDIWLHVKALPGSHVIIRTAGQEVSASTLEEAALLAAYYSKGKNSNNVPVDYTKVKHVRKPKGAKPGMVIYNHHKTIHVNPDKEKIKNLKTE